MVSSLLVLICVAIACLYYMRYWKFYWASYKFGGPLGWPIIGIGITFSNQKRVIENIGDLIQKYGSPLAAWVGPNFLLICADSETIKTILTSPACINKADLMDCIRPAVGNGLLLARAAQWHERRKMLAPTLGLGILQNCFAIFNQVSEDLVNTIQNEVIAKGGNVRSLLSKAVLEVACQTTMGKKMYFLQTESSKYLEDFYAATSLVVKKMATPWFQIPTVYKYSKYNKLEAEYKHTIRNFADTIIKEKQAALNVSGLSPSVDTKKRIFLDEVFHLLQNDSLSWDDLIDETNNILVTAADTLNSLTYMTVVCMAINMECQEKLRQEIQETFPEEKDIRDMTHKAINGMRYLDMVISETLRLFPSVPLIFRAATSDIYVSDNLRIPKDTQILIDFYHLHRDKNIWGPNADQFNPENFLPENLSKINSYGFVPYAKGIRSCMGIKYSQIVSKMFLVKIINRYRLSTKATMKNLNVMCSISLKLQEDVAIEFEDLMV